jgi:hypothetical protein
VREHAEVEQQSEADADPAAVAGSPVGLIGPSAPRRPLALPARAASRQQLERTGLALARAVRERRLAIARIFERPDASMDEAGAKAALTDFAKLSTADRTKELEARYPAGDVTRALLMIHAKPAHDPAVAEATLWILRWIEGYEARKYTGKTDAELAALQAKFLEAEAAKKTKPPKGWGGVAASATRYEALSDASKKAWDKRGKDAITKMAAWCAANKPDLGITESTFELEYSKVDQSSLGAIATVGSKEGKTVQVGFEFVLAVEMDERYALSTVIHELSGHVSYDPTGHMSYEQGLYQQSAKKAKKGTVKDMKGDETYAYWPSEIYSLLKELDYFTPVTATDAAKPVTLPDGTTTTMDAINYDPRGAIEGLLRRMQARWDAGVIEGLLRGFYMRLWNDPTTYYQTTTEFTALVEKVFGATVAASISKR